MPSFVSTSGPGTLHLNPGPHLPILTQEADLEIAILNNDVYAVASLIQQMPTCLETVLRMALCYDKDNILRAIPALSSLPLALPFTPHEFLHLLNSAISHEHFTHVQILCDIFRKIPPLHVIQRSSIALTDNREITAILTHSLPRLPSPHPSRQGPIALRSSGPLWKSTLPTL